VGGRRCSRLLKRERERERERERKRPLSNLRMGVDKEWEKGVVVDYCRAKTRI